MTIETKIHDLIEESKKLGQLFIDEPNRDLVYEKQNHVAKLSLDLINEYDTDWQRIVCEKNEEINTWKHNIELRDKWIEDKDNEIKFLKEEVESVKEEWTEQQEEIEVLQVENERHQEDLENAIETIKDKNKEIKRLTKEIEKLKSLLEVPQSTEENIKYRSGVIATKEKEIEKHKQTILDQFDRYDKERDELKEEIERLNNDVESALDSMQQKQKQIVALQLSIAELKDKMQITYEKNIEQFKEIERLTTRSKECYKQLTKLTKGIHTIITDMKQSNKMIQSFWYKELKKLLRSEKQE